MESSWGFEDLQVACAAPAPLLTPRPSRSALRRTQHRSRLREARGRGVGRPRLACSAACPRGASGRGWLSLIHSVQETSRVFLTSPYFCDWKRNGLLSLLSSSPLGAEAWGGVGWGVAFSWTFES